MTYDPNGNLKQVVEHLRVMSQKNRRAEVTTPVERLRALHVPQTTWGGEQFCAVCRPLFPWPCDTIQALDGLQEMHNDLLAIRPSRGLKAATEPETDIPNPAGKRRIREGMARQAERERKLKTADALADALRNQGFLQETAFKGVVWHIHDCPAAFNFDECNYRCRVAREAFALAGTEPYISPETRRDTEVYE